MKIRNMFRYSIKILLVLIFSLPLSSQNDTNKNSNDSLVFKEKYGLRLGLDLSKLGKSAFETNYTGFEINGDYRLTKRLYISGDLGYEDKKTNTDYLSSSASGGYLKAGIDFNLYNNWKGMENLIFSGLRLGISNFTQKRIQYTIYDTFNQTWGQIENQQSIDYNDMTSSWVELLFGVKTEILNNLFLGFNIQLKVRMTEIIPNNFENIYIPGFGKTYDSTKIGTGLNYSISYLIPVVKKVSEKSK